MINRDDIIHMALKSGFAPGFAPGQADALCKFAELVAAAEREECAIACELQDMESFGVLPVRAVQIAYACAAAIRARGEA